MYLASNNISVKNLSENDYVSYSEIYSEPNLWEFDNKPLSIDYSFEETLKTKEMSYDCWNEYGVFLDNVLIGLVSNYCSSVSGMSSIGYHFSSKYRGKGYATIAVRLFIDYLESLDKKIELNIDYKNIKSIALAKRLGFSNIYGEVWRKY